MCFSNVVDIFFLESKLKTGFLHEMNIYAPNIIIVGHARHKQLRPMSSICSLSCFASCLCTLLFKSSIFLQNL